MKIVVAHTNNIKIKVRWTMKTKKEEKILKNKTVLKFLKEYSPNKCSRMEAEWRLKEYESDEK